MAGPKGDGAISGYDPLDGKGEDGNVGGAVNTATGYHGGKGGEGGDGWGAPVWFGDLDTDGGEGGAGGASVGGVGQDGRTGGDAGIEIVQTRKLDPEDPNKFVPSDGIIFQNLKFKNDQQQATNFFKKVRYIEKFELTWTLSLQGTRCRPRRPKSRFT